MLAVGLIVFLFVLTGIIGYHMATFGRRGRRWGGF
jgi:hypothetical protein